MCVCVGGWCGRGSGQLRRLEKQGDLQREASDLGTPNCDRVDEPVAEHPVSSQIAIVLETGERRERRATEKLRSELFITVGADPSQNTPPSL